MLRVSFKGPLRRALGLEELELRGGKLDDILKELSERLGIGFVRDEKGIKMIVNVGGAKARFTVTFIHNGKNVIREGVEKLEEGILFIVTPVGGG